MILSLGGEVVVKAGDLISEKEAEIIGNSGVESIRIRSILTCEAEEEFVQNVMVGTYLLIN